jgi:hypothetical protein
VWNSASYFDSFYIFSTSWIKRKTQVALLKTLVLADALEDQFFVKTLAQI